MSDVTYTVPGGKRKFQAPNRVSKSIVQVKHCQACGEETAGGALCKKCTPRGRSDDISLCDVCPWVERCNVRVAKGYWVLCEYPDVSDLQRARQRENDEDGNLEHVGSVALRVYFNTLEQSLRAESGG